MAALQVVTDEQLAENAERLGILFRKEMQSYVDQLILFHWFEERAYLML